MQQLMVRPFNAPKNSEPQPRYLSVRAAAVRYGTSKSTVYVLLKHGKIKAIKFNGHTLVNRERVFRLTAAMGAEAMKAPEQAKEPAADTSAAPEVIRYEDAVSQGKELVSELEAVAARNQLQLGELADRVETKYKDRTLARFAKDIGVVECTLKRYRDVYRAWKSTNICAPGRKSFPPYAVLRELETHPDKEKIIQEHPNITKREAHSLKRQQSYIAKEKREQEQEERWLKHNRGWFKELVTLAGEVMRTVAAVNVDERTPEQQEGLCQVIDPNLLRRVRASGSVLVKTADRLAALCELDEHYESILATAEASGVQMAAE
jgi:excisionase family DNA binding protein